VQEVALDAGRREVGVVRLQEHDANDVVAYVPLSLQLNIGETWLVGLRQVRFWFHKLDLSVYIYVYKFEFRHTKGRAVKPDSSILM